MRVVLSRSASDYLKRETTYLRSKNPASATRFTALIREARRNMQRFPEVGNAESRLPIPGARTLVTGDYLIDYTRNSDSIVIVTIRHGRMNDALTPGTDLDDDLDHDSW